MHPTRLLLPLAIVTWVAAAPTPPPTSQDLITDLPDLSFETNYDQYAGYLLGRNDSEYNTTHMFYWLTKSQKDANKDPVVFWFNGGPGCSSLGGLFTENGPFHADQDGKVLFENSFGWNKMSNLVFIESPPAVGYSYRDDWNTQWNDDEIAELNAATLNDFFVRFNEFVGRDWYITGESYGGVYIPTMSREVVKRTAAGNFTNGENFKGFAIGNGFVDQKRQVNTVVEYFYYHAILSQSKWDNVQDKCCSSCPDNCDFHAHLKKNSVADGWITDGTPCGDAVAAIVGYPYSLLNGEVPDPYNSIQSCYQRELLTLQSNFWLPAGIPPPPPPPPGAFAKGNNTLWQVQYDSTDHVWGLPCWGNAGNNIYLNREDVLDALHISKTWRNHTKYWTGCNNQVYHTYNNTYINVTSVFDYLIEQDVLNLRLMLYNGDLDFVCNFLGDYEFMYALQSKHNLTEQYARRPWKYRDTPAGFAQSWGMLQALTVNAFLVIAGAGHFVPTDRAGPALQMLANFVWNTDDYSTPTGLDTTLAPLLTTTVAPETTTSAANSEDLIDSLPGSTFMPAFQQYSGYVDGDADGTYHIHYWLNEVQDRSVNDAPVIFWFNGGPGCSSLDGLLTENGPFHPNNDEGNTLYENVFAWNKLANVIYIESPPGVGFSYTDDYRITWNDTEVAELNAYAVNNFFKKYPHLARRKYYIAGESYGGIYVSLLTQNLVKLITQQQAENSHLEGMIIGNGCVDHEQQVNSLAEYLYYHGIANYDDWLSLQSLCCTGTCPDECDIYKHLINDPDYLDHWISDGTACGNQSYWIVEGLASQIGYDTYDIYQNCYDPMSSSGLLHFNSPVDTLSAGNGDTAVGLSLRKINYESTDHTAGLPCFGGHDASKWLNRKDVMEALHINTDWINDGGQWQDCNHDLHAAYSTAYHNVRDVWDWLVSQTDVPLRTLMYNGDTDTVCNFLGDRRFVYGVAQRNNLKEIDEGQWEHRGQMAGYYVRFSGNIDVLTVNVGAAFSDNE